MRSIGIVFKKDEMIMVSLRYGISRYFLDGYRILPFLDCKEEEKEDLILHNLKRFLKEYRGDKGNIFVALPRSDAFVHYVHLPLAVEEDLRTTLGYEIDRHTPFAADDVYYDYHVIRRMPESGMLYVMLIVIKRAPADYFIELFKKMKIRLQGIELTSTALFNGHAQQAAPEAGPDFSWLTTNKTVRRLLQPAAKRFPRLERLLQTPDAPEDGPAEDGPSPVTLLAEYLDNNHYELNLAADGVLHYSRVFECATCEQNEGHLQEMQRHGWQACIHLPFGQIEERPVEFILSGREMERDMLAGMPEPIRAQFQVVDMLPVQTDKLQGESFVSAPPPLLFVPVSLALKGLKPAALDINLIPPALRPRRKKSKRKLVVGAIACFVFCAIAALVLKWDMARTMELQMTDASLNKIMREYKQIELQKEETARIDRLYTAAQKIGSSDLGKLKLLGELTEIIPEDSWLTEFAYRADKREVRLSGYAVSASQLLPIIEESELFENVRFTSPITTDRRYNKEKFRLEMKITVAGEEKP